MYMSIIIKAVGICLLVYCLNTNAVNGNVESSSKKSLSEDNKGILDLFISNDTKSSNDAANFPVVNSSATNSVRAVNGSVKGLDIKNGTLLERNISGIVMEGGGKVKFENTSLPFQKSLQNSSQVEHSSSILTDKELDLSQNVNATQKIPRIVPRKGVTTPDLQESTESLDTDVATIKIENGSINNCKVCANKTMNKNANESTNSCWEWCGEGSDRIGPHVSNTNSTINPSNTVPSNTSSSSSTVLPISAHSTNSIMKGDALNSSLNYTTTTLHSVKKKPSVTLDINDTPQNFTSYQKPSENSQNRTDYVVPVVGVIFAIPLIVILSIVLYKKGSEFWERRHYRRMDFLIDGMYNE